jgi:hypothetical protein
MEKGYKIANGEIIFGLNEDCRSIVEFLITNVGQADEFLHEFILVSCNSNLATNRYRLHRIKERDMSCDEFCSCFKNNHIEALCELFMYQIKKIEMLKLTKKLEHGILSIEELYHMHKKEPRIKLLRFLL